jgi:hypothetical protein
VSFLVLCCMSMGGDSLRIGTRADGRMIEQAKSTAANVTDRENLNK